MSTKHEDYFRKGEGNFIIIKNIETKEKQLNQLFPTVPSANSPQQHYVQTTKPSSSCSNYDSYPLGEEEEVERSHCRDFVYRQIAVRFRFLTNSQHF